MARKRTIQLKGISSVAASGTATVDVPLSFGRMHRLILQHGYASGTNTATAAATNVTKIEAIVDGTVIRNPSGTQLRDINLLNGTAYDFQGVPNTAPGVSMTMYFAEPWRTDPRDRDALAWSTKPMNTLKFNVTLGAASTPTLLAYAVVDDVQVAGNPLYVKQIVQPFNASSTSFDITGIDRRGFLMAIHFYPDSGGTNTATKLTVKKDGPIIHEFTTSANLALLVNSGMTPAASGRTSNIYDYVCDHDDALSSVIDLEGSRELVMSLEAASAMSGTVTAIVERLEKLDGTTG